MTTKKQSILRKGIIFILILTTILSCSLTSLAALPQDHTITPFWANMNLIDLDITFSNNKGIALGDIDRKACATLIEATLTVYKQVGTSWVFVDSTSKSSTRSLAIDLEFDAEEGATYKAVLDVTAYGTSVDESETITKIKTN